MANCQQMGPSGPQRPCIRGFAVQQSAFLVRTGLQQHATVPSQVGAACYVRVAYYCVAVTVLLV